MKKKRKGRMKCVQKAGKLNKKNSHTEERKSQEINGTWKAFMVEGRGG